MAGRQQGHRLTRRGFLGACAATVAGACAPGAPTNVSREAAALHDESLVLDLHVDTLLWKRLLGYDLATRHEPWLPRAAFAWHFDLPRAAEGGLDGAVLGIVVSPESEEPEQLWALSALARVERGRGLAQTLETLDLLRATADSSADRLVLARSGSELRAAMEAGRFGALAALEGAHGVGDRIADLRRAWERGLRMLGLVHFQRSAAAWPMTEPAFDDRGLTPFGFDLLAAMQDLPLVCDLAHVNAAGVDDALVALSRPCVVSHTACRALEPWHRNLADEQIRRIADRGGVVGVAMGRRFVGDGGVDAFVSHVEHVADVGGLATPALGSDWDGGIVPVAGLEDVRGLPRVTQALLERGWKPDAIRGVLGENALRVLTEALG